MENKVSIVIPVYNAENTIKKCIDSAINQTFKNLEIIIVNDGSTDNTDKICKKLREDDDRIIYIKKNNGGVSSARNVGIDISSGNYIFFLDSDDYIDLDLIENLITNIKQYKVIKAGFKTIKKSKEEKTSDYNCVFTREEFIKQILIGKIGGYSWGYLFRKELIGENRVDENTSHMEDTIFVIKCLKKVEEIPCINYSYYNYVIRDSSLTRKSKDEINELDFKEYIYSLNEIDKNVNKEYHCYIERRKAIFLEKTMTKVSNYKQLKDLTIKFKEYIDINDKAIINKYYKLIIHLFNNENFMIWYFIIRIKKILKKIRKYIEY